MKIHRTVIRFILLLCPVFLCAFMPAVQEPAATFDPFASGSFYNVTTPEPEATDDPNRFGRDKSEMVYIPEGTFIMGSDSPTSLPASRPAHEVKLKGYLIDRYEVTNAQFQKCVQSGYCYLPRDLSSATREDYYENEAYADYPVIHVDWNQANAYCTWAGKRLPTEAEWEKAARGTEGFIYPWGNDLPDELPMQISRFEGGDTVPVDSFPEGASPYGVYNMMGNVWEWTVDQYDRYYYSKSPAEDPKSVTGGVDLVIRGYSWAYPFSRYDITDRNSSYVLNHTHDLGFRCVMDK